MSQAAMSPQQKEQLKHHEQQQLEQAAKTPHPPKLGGSSGAHKHHHKGGVTGADKDPGHGAQAHEDKEKETRSKLPADIIKQFKEVDLSGAWVVTNSATAKAKKVQGFATHDEIHIAPGADEKKVLRHEAAHLVQFRNGGKSKGGHDTEHANESAANKAEGGAATSPADLGSAPPNATRHKEKESAEPADKGAPSLDFNGMHLAGISGTFAKKFEPESGVWKDGINLWKIGTFWPFPMLPVAGIDISSEGKFGPTAEMSAEGKYTWSKADKSFELEGSLGASVGVALSASVLGGLALGVLGVRVGVGLEAEGVLKLAASAKTGLLLKYFYETNKVQMEYTPLEIDISGSLDLTLSLAAFAHSWFGDKVKKWPFANFRIATFEGFKWPVKISFGSDGVTTESQPVVSGKFSWGSPPAPEGDSNHEAKALQGGSGIKDIGAVAAGLAAAAH